MSSKLEQAIAAIRRTGMADDAGWDDVAVRTVVRAVLTAVREPDATMKDAVVATLDDYETWDPDHWAVMIDAILAEKR